MRLFLLLLLVLSCFEAYPNGLEGLYQIESKDSCRQDHLRIKANTFTLVSEFSYIGCGIGEGSYQYHEIRGHICYDSTHGIKFMPDSSLMITRRLDLHLVEGHEPDMAPGRYAGMFVCGAGTGYLLDSTACMQGDSGAIYLSLLVPNWRPYHPSQGLTPSICDLNMMDQRYAGSLVLAHRHALSGERIMVPYHTLYRHEAWKYYHQETWTAAVSNKDQILYLRGRMYRYQS